MSIEYCKQCDTKIDTDFDAEHFDEEYNGCRDTFAEKELKNNYEY